MSEISISLWKWSAWLLLIGGIIFWIGACTPPYRQWMTRDTKEYLVIIDSHKINWYIIHACFAIGVLITVVGVQLLTQLLLSVNVDKVFPNIAVTLYVLGTSFWVLNIAFRLTVTMWAAQQFTALNQLHDSFKTWMDWSNLIFSIYMVVAYLSTGLIGLSMKESSLFPNWLVWFNIIFGFVGVAGYIVRFPFYAPPLMVHLPWMLAGITMLLKK